MDLWHGPLGAFVRAAESGSIAGEMTGKFVTAHGCPPTASEVRSWEASLRSVAGALESGTRRDVGVVVGAPTAARAGESRVGEPVAGDVGVVAEYHLPFTGRRVDVLLCGRGGDGAERALVLELKQWSDATLVSEDSDNLWIDEVEREHPSQQALDYAGWLADYHGAFGDEGMRASAAAYCHNLARSDGGALFDPRFASLLERSPLFTSEDRERLAGHVFSSVGSGRGLDVLERVVGGGFHPSRSVLDTLDRVIAREREWHLLDVQRVAYNAVLEAVRRAQRKRGRSALLIRGGPGTGKSVIAVQLLADALRFGWRAVHSTGGKAFTTTLRSKFKGADQLFVWNMNLRNEPTQSLDLLLVDEAHRIRETSNILYTPRAKRSDKAQVEEMLDAAKVAVFFLDENQFVRPDEVGTTALIRETTARMGVPLKEFDLAAQFRCGGCEAYVAWVDRLLGFRSGAADSWHGRYRFEVVDNVETLHRQVLEESSRGTARLVAGFCWPWSDARNDGTLVSDVRIGGWALPWNRKPDSKKRYTPAKHPYTLWAETSEGLGQVGCIYSAQGFEFDTVGVIWGPDLLWRDGGWRAEADASEDRPIKRADADTDRLVRNAYRVLLTRGRRRTVVFCVDPETRRHLREACASV